MYVGLVTSIIERRSQFYKKITISTKDDSPASTISTQLVLPNLWLALADLGGEARMFALPLTLACMPWLVATLRIEILHRLLAKAGHSGNDLRVLDKPQSRSGLIQFIFTLFFSLYCSFIQCFQLQSSKVSEGSNIAV